METPLLRDVGTLPLLLLLLWALVPVGEVEPRFMALPVADSPLASPVEMGRVGEKGVNSMRAHAQNMPACALIKIQIWKRAHSVACGYGLKKGNGMHRCANAEDAQRARLFQYTIPHTER